MCLRVADHVILDVKKKEPKITITVDDEVIEAYEGEPILAALLSNGIRINRYTAKNREPRGLFCGIGQCSDCSMIVDGQPNIRTCITPARSGMVIKTQSGQIRGSGND